MAWPKLACPPSPRVARGWLAALAAALLVACGAPAPAGSGGTPSLAASSGAAPLPAVRAWPALPSDRAALAALVSERTRHAPRSEGVLGASELREAVRAAIRGGSAAVGFGAVVGALDAEVRAAAARGERPYLLFGTHHDAPEQVDAFRRLVGPRGLANLALAAVELLQSRGRWPGEDERGDDGLVAAYVEHGEPSALAELAAWQHRRNYTAWKYGYVERVVDLVVQARASSARLVACDMPSPLQRRLRDSIGSEAEVLRDLHCALTLEEGEGGGPVAAFWGEAHLDLARLPRFLPADAAVLRVSLVGGRLGSVGLDAELGLTVTEPVLVAVGPRSAARFALLLPAGRLAARVDRVRDPGAPGGAGPALEVVGVEGELVLAGMDVALDGSPRTLPAAAGDRPFLLQAGKFAVAGVVAIDPAAGASLELEADGTLRVVTRAPTP